MRRLPADQLGDRLGYAFANPELLTKALTHRSAGRENNERLEFLGDAVLGLAIANALFHRFPNAAEGQLSRLRASLVRKETLAAVARSLSLGSFMALGPGELKSGGHARASILADALEAIFGAVYLDGGSIEAENLVLRLMQSRLESTTIESCHKDSKTRLQEWLQSRQLGLPNYEITGVSGADHNQRFSCCCQVPSLGMEGLGEGSSRRKAEQDAAFNVLRQLENDS